MEAGKRLQILFVLNSPFSPKQEQTLSQESECFGGVLIDFDWFSPFKLELKPILFAIYYIFG